MNNFTKDELKKIKLGLYVIYQKDGLVDTENLISRIQSMIDNYTEKKQTVFVRGEERDLREFDNEKCNF